MTIIQDTQTKSLVDLLKTYNLLLEAITIGEKFKNKFLTENLKYWVHLYNSKNKTLILRSTKKLESATQPYDGWANSIEKAVKEMVTFINDVSVDTLRELQIDEDSEDFKYLLINPNTMVRLKNNLIVNLMKELRPFMRYRFINPSVDSIDY